MFMNVYKILAVGLNQLLSSSTISRIIVNNNNNNIMHTSCMVWKVKIKSIILQYAVFRHDRAWIFVFEFYRYNLRIEEDNMGHDLGY